MTKKGNFIEFMVKSNALIFGDFVAKSGRKTPYMINTGNFQTAKQIAILGEYYADCLNSNVDKSVNVLFGPAYKGIHLAVAASVALYNKYNRDISITFNRKEKKDHGEGGQIIGYIPQNNDRIAIIEDVITAGTAVRESINLLSNIADVKITNLIVSVDRLERGLSNKTTIQELNDDYGIQTNAIVTIEDILDYLHNREIDGKIVLDGIMKNTIEDHLNLHGVR
ncbi:orotate phosphoribosyltransferase [Paenibacillus chondroitinus]|uniref:Orotate phosphoribosyltransferase n=1 Tax=Paenibacillus chondroitinus TaxID=59842 RepID=A0ABU6DIQ4_9BACL|nr:MULTISPECIES: orotate phosphoribosyltransferase [Paenibacillus]MCY9662678.1 orotate phosphoribosyltransferase [Paenibacillus anseongense]MEB4796697.1 orotate phosphoribosyltransferase [Paenibacillus chondroitinus]